LEIKNLEIGWSECGNWIGLAFFVVSAYEDSTHLIHKQGKNKDSFVKKQYFLESFLQYQGISLFL
jgi:hypothetical protein